MEAARERGQQKRQRSAAAERAYDAFLSGWAKADTSIPILGTARTERAALNVASR